MRRIFTLAVLNCSLLLAVSTGRAQDEPALRFGALTVSRATVLRSKPSNSAPALRKLPKTTALRWINGQKKGNFFRVFGPKGPQGWVSINDVQVITPAPPPVLTQSPAPPCVANLSVCPPNGCGATGSTQALVNEAKRRAPLGSAPVNLTFADFAALQDQTDELVEQG